MPPLSGPAAISYSRNRAMTRKTQSSSDGVGTNAGVRRHPTPRRRLVWLLPIAVGLPIVATILAVLVIRLGAEERTSASTSVARGASAPPETAASPPPHAIASPATVARSPAASAVRRAPRDAAHTDAKASQPPTGRASGPGRTPPEHTRPEIDAADAIEALRAEGETGGIAAFGLPGTDPPKPGVIVPEGFELPEGFVRHYQTTDDGQQLPPILMLDPDYDLVDAAGKRITPPGGIVPPELVPPGMPIQMLEVPARRTRTTEPRE